MLRTALFLLLLPGLALAQQPQPSPQPPAAPAPNVTAPAPQVAPPAAPAAPGPQAGSDSATTRCRFLLGTIGTVQGTLRASGPGTCEATNVSLGFGPARFSVDRFVMFAPPDSNTAPPQRLHAEAHGTMFQPPSPNPLARFIAGVLGHKATVLLDYDHDANGTLRLGQFTVVSPTLGDTTISAQFEEIGDLSALQSAKLRRLRLHMDGRGFFENYVVPFTASAMLGNAPDPVAAFNNLTQSAAAFMQQALGNGAASPDSIDALTRFFADLPHPTHALDVAIELPNPLPFETLSNPDRLRAALPKGALLATYGD